MSEAPFPASSRSTAGWRARIREHRIAVPGFLAACLLLGAILSPAWALVARLPGYVVSSDLTAHIDELGLAEVFAADAWFVVLAGAVGIVIGVAGWILFHHLGAWIAPIAALGATLAGLSLWLVGLLVGRRGFEDRLAAAQAGDVVPIDLALHAHAALLVAPFAAVLVVMLASAFWPEQVQAPPADDDDLEPTESD